MPTSRTGPPDAAPPARAAGIALGVLLVAGSAAAQPSFHDATGAAGLSYLQHAPQATPNCLFNLGSFCEPERMAGGAAVADVDGDGHDDLFVTRLDAPDILFRSLGNGTFEDFTASAGLDAFDLQSNGAGFADLDNDGDPDLVVVVLGDAGDATNGRNYLFLNDGSGHFSEAAVARGADVATGAQRRIYSVSFGDYDRDGWIDIHTNEWLPPLSSNSRLLRNLGPASPGFFADVTAAAGVSLDGLYPFASSLSDVDADGWPDLVVAGDFGTSRLFWNDGDGTFTDGTVAAGVGTDENGMGSTLGDYDGDGDLDWFVTSIHDAADTCGTGACNWGATGNRLYRYDGGRVFGDATDTAGVREGYWGWGAAFFDYDNDGDLDLAMTNGFDIPGTTLDDPFNSDPVRLWENDGTGAMTEVSAARGFADTGSGKGLLVFDYDEDGDLDLFLVNNAGTPRLFRNDGGNANGWLRVDVAGTISNRDGLGARITVQHGGKTQVREVGTSTHFLGQSERTAHFGLGPGASPVDRIEVYWPRSGQTSTFEGVPRNSTILAVEPAAAAPGLGLPAAVVLVGSLVAAGRWRGSGRT
ncbi:MAG: CRTAC1 family protein [Myxococcota bacterium]|nr:CRTAC1 family protein [Myxococcota bacterium]